MSVNAVDKSTGNLIKTAGNPVEDASGIHYSHTTSGMSATNVQDAIDESYSSLKSGLTNLDNEVNGDATTYPYADVITIEDAVPANLADCSVKIEPVQDLHGYDKPWVGGAGKNKFVYPYGNTTKTENNVTFTDNGDGTVTVVTTSSGASNDTEFVLCNSSTGTSITLPTGNYILNGCPANGSTSSYWISVYKIGQNIGNDVGSGYSFTSTGELFSLSIRVKEGTIISSAMTFKPMIRLVAETDATFAPYTNICPISGHTEVDVQRVGKNLWTNVVYKFSTGINSNGNEYSVDVYNLYKLSVKENTNYVLSLTETESLSSSNYYRVQFLDASDNALGLVSGTYGNVRPSKPFTTPSGTVQIKISVRKSSADIQLELGSTATSYVPYAGKTYTIALGDTIYGGTVDFDSGVMTASWASEVFDGSDDETWYDNKIEDGYSTPRPARLVDSICDKFKNAGARTSVQGEYWAGGSNLNFVCSEIITSLADWKTYLANNPLQICYQFSTPTTVQLTPQQIQLLKGTNTLTASTGQISVTVNGVSGSIGQVQEQVNELAEKVNPIPIIRKGVVNFTNLAIDNVFSSDIAFDTPMPNADYTVTASASGTTVAVCNIGNRTVNGFTVYVRNIGTAAIGGAVMWQVIG